MVVTIVRRFFYIAQQSPKAIKILTRKNLRNDECDRLLIINKCFEFFYISKMVDMELLPHGITLILKRNVLILFVCITLFFYYFFFLYIFYSLGGYNRNKICPRRPRIQFKKMVAIPCWSNINEPSRIYVISIYKGNKFYLNKRRCFMQRCSHQLFDFTINFLI